MSKRLISIMRRSVRENYTSGKNKVFTYLLFDDTYYKIGKSTNPSKRLRTLQVANVNIKMICCGLGASEEYLHERYKKQRVAGEWFKLNESEVFEVASLICSPDKEYFVDGITLNKHNSLPIYLGMLEEERAKVDRFCEYVIGFGKHKGKLLCKMTSVDEVSYCKWYRNKLKDGGEFGDEWDMFDKWVSVLNSKEGRSILYDIQREEWIERKNKNLK